MLNGRYATGVVIRIKTEIRWYPPLFGLYPAVETQQGAPNVIVALVSGSTNGKAVGIAISIGTHCGESAAAHAFDSKHAFLFLGGGFVSVQRTTIFDRRRSLLHIENDH